MSQRIRIRDLSPGQQKSHSKIYLPNGNLSSESIRFLTPRAQQITIDAIHPAWPPKPGNMLNIGGEFLTTKSAWTQPGRDISISFPRDGIRGARVYSGYWWPVTPWVIGPLPIPGILLTNYWGTKGISSSVPTRPQAGVAQAVGEMRQLPKLPALDLYRSIAKGVSRRDLFRRAVRGGGSEYLNTTFGWMPLERDLKDLHEAHKSIEEKVNQLLRDSGKVVRRRRHLLDEVSVVENEGTTDSIGVGPGSNYLTPTQPYTSRVSERTRIWTSAAFTYYITAGEFWTSEIKRSEQILAAIYGSRIGIDTLYNLAPWSWMLDWVGNLGDVAANMAAFSNDGLVMKYGYVMFEKEVRTTFRLSAKYRYSSGTASTSATSVQTIKLRRRANPYGFGIAWNGLNVSQLAILAALGLSRT